MNYMHPDDEPGFGPRLWDATPGVCCAAYQLGACSHTEDYDWDEELANEELAAVNDPALTDDEVDGLIEPTIVYPF